MFFHSFKYSVLTTLRNKGLLFWSLIFTMMLGTFFQATFGTGDVSNALTEIEVVECIDDTEIKDMFDANIKDVKNNDKKLLKVDDEKSMEEAKTMLKNNDIYGIFYSENGELKLLINGNGTISSILSNITGTYHQTLFTVKEISKDDPQKIENALAILSTAKSNNELLHFGDNQSDPFIFYFYNLIAMSCLFSVYSGQKLISDEQANLSYIAMRKTISRTTSFLHITASIIANWLILSISTIISFVYLVLIGVDFGNKIPLILLIIFIGSLVGISFGYFIGSIGKLKEGAKSGILTGLTLFCCFISGLMVNGIDMLIETTCPIINRINPAKLISDSFYVINNYTDHTRLYRNLLTMIIISTIFIILGTLTGRRKSYASL